MCIKISARLSKGEIIDLHEFGECLIDSIRHEFYDCSEYDTALTHTVRTIVNLIPIEDVRE